MARKATVQPVWLDALLIAWGMSRVRAALGFPSESFMFKERIPSPARSYEPTGFCATDYRELEAAIERLEEKHQLVLIRCYKPWAARDVEAMLGERYDVGDRTWRNWLHDAAALLAADMGRQQAARRTA
jgi:hypothetical protein